jgi:hypothetical protein
LWLNSTRNTAVRQSSYRMGGDISARRGFTGTVLFCTVAENYIRINL